MVWLVGSADRLVVKKTTATAFGGRRSLFIACAF